VQINESDLIFLNTLGAGASSIVKKALLIRQKGTGLTKPKYVAVKCISNVDDVRLSLHACLLADMRWRFAPVSAEHWML
jgi:hypothetical protein